MNIEKLTIEREALINHAKAVSSGLVNRAFIYGGKKNKSTILFTDASLVIDKLILELEAKALQSSEPVAEPDAWLVPMILDFTEAKKVHFTRSEKGKNLTDDELKAELQGTVSWKAETVYINDSNEPVTDKYGVRHYAKPLFTHPPASVSLEKYNKLLDALINCVMSLKGYRNELNDNQPCDAEVKGEQAIAEAEGKEG